MDCSLSVCAVNLSSCRSEAGGCSTLTLGVGGSSAFMNSLRQAPMF